MRIPNNGVKPDGVYDFGGVTIDMSHRDISCLYPLKLDSGLWDHWKHKTPLILHPL